MFIYIYIYTHTYAYILVILQYRLSSKQARRKVAETRIVNATRERRILSKGLQRRRVAGGRRGWSYYGMIRLAIIYQIRPICYTYAIHMLCYAMLCYAMIYYTILSYTILNVLQCFAMLCYALLCFAMPPRCRRRRGWATELHHAMRPIGLPRLSLSTIYIYIYIYIYI